MPYILLLTLVSCFTFSEGLALPAEVNVEPSERNTNEPSTKSHQKVLKSKEAPLRIEEPDGTLRPIPPSAMPESRMSTEGLQEVPDAGGGTKVDVKGRFQSILQVPVGSDKAIHGEPEELQPTH
jgi:hypothetical protein